MAIFTAGSIPLSSDINRIREEVYAIGRRELDSSAIKVSLRKCANGVNYVAFLPRVKLYYENILKTAASLSERSVVVFELDYKSVGVICEGESIVDYILDKPEEYARENALAVVYADNSGGAKLVSINLDQQRRELWMGSFLLLCTVVLTSLIFYVGYDHLREMPLLRSDKVQTLQEYRELVKTQEEQIAQMTRKVDMAGELEALENLSRTTGSRLQQVRFEKGKTCVDIRSETIETLRAQLPKDAQILKENTEEGSMEYCYEKI